jgi:hypothetical protein
MKFHAMTDGYSYKAMADEAFRALLHDYRLEVARDFGIYGNKYMYVAQVNRADNLVGFWLRNPATLTTYINFFETCWNSPSAINPKSINTQGVMTLDDLYEDNKI